MSNGFGFSFPTNDGDDDDDKNRRDDNNPFSAFGFGVGGNDSGSGSGAAGAGGLGDLLNQFGQMLSGMGSSMNSEGASPVNYDMAQRIASQEIKGAKKVTAEEKHAVEESVRLADLWLDAATDLPASSGKVEAWNAEDWLRDTMPAWKRLVTPVAKNMSQAQMDSLPEEAREMMGPLSNMMNQMSGMNYGMQLGHSLGDLAKQILSGTDFGLPVAPAGVVAVLPPNVQAAAQDLEISTSDVLVYIAAREAARQRLFKHVPWLVERLFSSVEEYAMGLEIDTSHIEEATRELNLESGDPQAIQEAMEKLQGMDLSPRITSRNANATARVETLIALVEGWVEHVVTEAMGERIPATSALNEAWARRRATGGSAEQAFSKVVGIELGAPKVSAATELWRRATNAVGTEKRDSVWDHPDFLPTAEHLDNPAAFIDSLLDDAPSDDFDAEFAKLEEELRNSGADKGDAESDGDDKGGDDTDSEKE
ncbi:zinc-dependent metalloprotease [Corynebacterium massiliense]|uniref:Hydrolase n=1 Tax=Corynebacterium massiliense DSM 45435 TaxID=1121364 RepID=A0ABY7U7T4_9CORY|nr:zinc-dependent metalloprotease [Corynebacterium massiliense]WCZ32024.1 hypothetical protein CMASS_02825 [Corynebacterium massiliense DSM 45435]